MKKETLSIINRKGYALQAYLDLPVNKTPEHFAIFAHCFTCSSNLTAARNISRALTNQSFGVVRFDFTGLGNSEGSFQESHFSANVNDLLDVHTYMAERYHAPELMIGHSLGGAAVLVAASKLEDVKAVATIGAPSTVSHVKHLFSYAGRDNNQNGQTKINIGGRPFVVDQEFIDDFDKTDLPHVVKKMRKPLLIMHSVFDQIVGIENAKELFDTAFHQKSYISLDKADHLLTDKRDSIYAGQTIGVWAQHYFPRKTSIPR